VSRKVWCATLGCDKNLVDSEALLGRFALRGVQPVAEPDDADIWVLNTCGFIEAARADIADTVAALAAAKELGASRAELLDYRTSYDVHPNSSFVGYAGVVLR